MANIDTNSTVAMLERMKDKVSQQEALADAYGEIAGESKSLDNEIDAALGDNSDVKAAKWGAWSWVKPNLGLVESDKK